MQLQFNNRTFFNNSLKYYWQACWLCHAHTNYIALRKPYRKTLS